MIHQGDDGGSAMFSDCKSYRYVLTRRWSPGHSVTWIMLNPSTADGFANDATIRRCMSFSRRWGYGRLLAVNLFALRSTDPMGLYAHTDPVGPENDATIFDACSTSTASICAWGTHGRHLGRGEQVLELLRSIGAQTLCLGRTAGGQPRHPLYLKADLYPVAMMVAS